MTHKVARIPRFYIYMKQFENNAGSARISAAFKRLLKIYLLLLIAAHWAGCGWVHVGLVTRRDAMVNWIDADSVQRMRPLNHNSNHNSNSNSSSSSNGSSSSGGGGGGESIDASFFTRTFVTYLRAVYFILVGTSTVGYVSPTSLLRPSYVSPTSLSAPYVYISYIKFNFNLNFQAYWNARFSPHLVL